MAISRIPEEPNKIPPKIADKKAEDFINGAVKKVLGGASGKAVVNMKFDASLLEKIDEAAEKMGINRTAWLHVASSEKLSRDK